MSSSFSGADVEQLDILASRFEAQAARVREIIVASSALLFVTEWTGGKVDRIRSDWNSSARPSLASLAETLQRSADSLKREADQQRQASGGGASRRGNEGLSRPESDASVGPGPKSTQDLINGIRGMNDKEDAFRIQNVVGPDGVERFIVYISGTGSASGGLMSPEENVAASFGVPTHTRENLERLIAEHIGDQTDAEIMLVGHSQGGMYAEAIAASGQFNVKEVLTVGAPGVPVPNGYGGANVTRLQHNADWVVNGVEGGRSVLLGPQGHGLSILGAAGGLDTSGAVETFRAGNPMEGFWNENSNPWDSQSHMLAEGDYNWLADQYDSSTDSSIVAARERQGAFLDGTITWEAK